MSVNQYAVGLVGAGYISDWHMRALNQLDNTRVAAVCDLSHSRAKQLADQCGAAVYTDYHKMLSDEKLDAVQILTPPHIHYSAAKDALEAGVNVLLEKPMCASREDCQSLVDLAKAKNLNLGVGHNFLFYPVYEQLRKDLKSGKLGRIDHVTISWQQDLPQTRFGPFNAWMLADPKNILLEIGSHSISHMVDLIGQPDEISSITPSRELIMPGNRKFYRRWQVNTFCGQTAVELRFCFDPGFPEHTIHVRGTLGSATVNFTQNTYHLRRDTTYSMDINRYCISKQESKSIRKHGFNNLKNYILGKAKLTNKDNFYGYSIACALESYYKTLKSPDKIDSRLSGELGTTIIGLGEKIGQLSGVTQCTPIESTESDKPAVSPEILVLGGTGFIGRELVQQLLDAGHPVRIMTRSRSSMPFDIDDHRLDIFEGSMLNGDDLEAALSGIKTVYHLARAHANTWEDFLEYDVKGTELVAEKCLTAGIKRLIYTGTIDSYYAGNPSDTITEETPLDSDGWRNFYARAKALSEQKLMTLHREKGLPVVLVRPGIVIGKGSSPIHWGVGMWNGLGVVQVWGPGETKLPIVTVEDTAKGLVQCLTAENIEGESFNLIGDPLITAKEYLSEIEKYMNIELQKHYTSSMKFYFFDALKWVVKVLVRHPGRARKPSYRDFASRKHAAFYDCSKAKNVLGWKPISDKQTLIEMGIHKPCDELMQ